MIVKRIVSVIALLVLSTWISFAATDLTQELDNKGWTLKVNNTLTINYQDSTFKEIVVFNARTVSQLEWWIDSSRFDDKWSEVLYLSFKNNIGLTTIPEKEINFWFNNLQNYQSPVLITYKNNKLVVIDWNDNAWTYVFNITGSIDGAYKIVDSLGNKENTSLISDTVDLLWTNLEDEVEFNSAWDENVEVILSDLPTKGVNDMYYIILSLMMLVLFALWFKSYKNS